MWRRSGIACLACLLAACSGMPSWTGGWGGRGQAAPEGYLDARFDGDGKLELTGRGLGTLSGIGLPPVIQPDGKLVVAAYSDQGFVLARFTSDGLLDTTFGLNGLVQVYDVDVESQSVRDVQALRDGKLLLVGSRAHGDGAPGTTFYLARFTADGQPDDSFGEGGSLTTRIASSSAAWTAVELADGRLLVGGNACVEADPPSPTGQHICLNSEFALARYQPDGQLDPAFGWKGIFILPLTRLKETVRRILPLPDGKLLLLGNSREDLAWVRLGADGKLDPDFAHGEGKAVLLDSVSGELPFFVQALPDGKLLLAGTRAEAGVPPAILLQRYHADGTPDRSFAEAGRRWQSLGMGSALSDILPLPDGRWLVLAETCVRQRLVAYNKARVCEESDITLLRYTADGTQDLQFGQQGALVASVSPLRDSPLHVHPLAGGDLLVVSRSCRNTACDAWDFALVRVTLHRQAMPAR